MPRTPNGGFTYSTLADYRDSPGFTMSVYCEGGGGCHHGAELDMAALCERLGADHSCMAPDLKPHFKCSKCGSKEVSFRIRHDGLKRD